MADCVELLEVDKQSVQNTKSVISSALIIILPSSVITPSQNDICKALWNGVNDFNQDDNCQDEFCGDYCQEI